MTVCTTWSGSVNLTKVYKEGSQNKVKVTKDSRCIPGWEEEGSRRHREADLGVSGAEKPERTSVSDREREVGGLGWGGVG